VTVPATAVADVAAPRRHRVVARTVESTDTVTLALDPVDVVGGAGGAWRPGQFNMLWVPGVGEVPISISGADGTATVLHTIRSLGSVTRALCDLVPGRVVGVRGPFGTGWDLGPAGADVIVVGGGLGLAPLRAAMRVLLTERDRHGRVAFVAGARTPERVLYRDEIAGWADRGVQVVLCAEEAGPAWPGHVGLVTEPLPELAVDPAGAVALVCGPEVMMRHSADALVHLGVAPAHVQLSLERAMDCGVGTCGHCQLGELFVCRDGPVVTWDRAGPLLEVPER
jgi:anaerobic sulfite reductase subunit B